MMKNWPREELERQLVESFGGQGRGLRMGQQRDGTIVAAMDFDIPPNDTADKAWQLLVKFLGLERAKRTLVREGRRAKFCALVQTAKPMRAVRSP